MKLTIALLTLSLSLTAVGQNKIQGSLGLNYSIAEEGSDDTMYDYWKAGINVGSTAHIAIWDELSFRPGVSYQYLFFDKFVQYVYIGETAVSSHGTGSHVVRLSGELHLGDGEERNPHFSFSLGGGYAIERPGTMTVSWAEFGEGKILYTTEHHLGHRDYWYGSVGIDLGFSIAKDLAIGTSVRYFRSPAQYSGMYSNDNVCWMLNCNIIYDILQF